MIQHKERIAREIEKFLATGDSDLLFRAWEGATPVERMKRGHAETMTALVDEVRSRTTHAKPSSYLETIDLPELARRKAERMVRGLFPKTERKAVISALVSSVVFLTPRNIETVLRDCNWLSTAWDLANLYLLSIDAKPLGENAPLLVGLSEEQTCYVSQEYFKKSDPFDDFVVHEMAHIFHNCKRRTVGLKETRTKEWLLNIGFAQRENFAYACEAYSCILEMAESASQRRKLASQFDGFKGIAVDRIDSTLIADMVREACEARNGWKVILARCR